MKCEIQGPVENVGLDDLTASVAGGALKLFVFSGSYSLFVSDCQTSLSLPFLCFLLPVNSR